jgi:hypothetical protein
MRIRWVSPIWNPPKFKGGDCRPFYVPTCGRARIRATGGATTSARTSCSKPVKPFEFSGLIWSSVRLMSRQPPRAPSRAGSFISDGVRVPYVRRQRFWDEGRRRQMALSAKVGPIIASGIWSVQRRFRGGQHCEHLPTSTRAGHNDGMDFVLRDLRHLLHVAERGLNVLGRRLFGLIPGQMEECRHQCSHFA